MTTLRPLAAKERRCVVLARRPDPAGRCRAPHALDQHLSWIDQAESKGARPSSAGRVPSQRPKERARTTGNQKWYHGTRTIDDVALIDPRWQNTVVVPQKCGT